jgi:trans-aconitate methyltransferase
MSTTTEWDAEEYAKRSSLQQAMAEEVLASIPFTGRERVLDIGCGDGKVTAALAARVPQGSVLGIDPAKGMVAFAKEKFGRALPNLHFAKGDARKLEYRGQFDLVVSFNALHWVHEQAAALRGIAAALKPGGRAYLRFVPNRPPVSTVFAFEETSRTERWAEFFEGKPCPFAKFTAEEYRALVEGAGLEARRIEVKDYRWDFGTEENYLAFFRAVAVPWTQWLPEEEVEDFVVAAMAQHRKSNGIAAGSGRHLFCQMVVKAGKKQATGSIKRGGRS